MGSILGATLTHKVDNGNILEERDYDDYNTGNSFTDFNFGNGLVTANKQGFRTHPLDSQIDT
jgi:hypothetical protein